MQWHCISLEIWEDSVSPVTTFLEYFKIFLYLRGTQNFTLISLEWHMISKEFLLDNFRI